MQTIPTLPDAEPESIQLFRQSVKQRQKEMLATSLRSLESALLTARSGSSDEARLRSYQRDLLAMRQLSPRPRCTVSLTLRQCVAARKMARHARHALASCRNNIKELSGTHHQ